MVAVDDARDDRPARPWRDLTDSGYPTFRLAEGWAGFWGVRL